MRRQTFVFLLFFATLAVAAPEDSSRIRKARRLETSAEPQAALRKEVKRRSAGRSHLQVEMAATPQAEQLQEMERRGLRVVEYLSDTGFVLAAEDGSNLDGLDVLAAARPRSEDKISPLLKKAETSGESDALVVEFFSDVEPAEARALLDEQGFDVVEHPDMMEHQMLVRPGLRPLSELVEWDEVANVFPASEELSRGERVRGCRGAMAGLGYVGQVVATVGNGWDGTGVGSADLGYYFEKLTTKVDETSAKQSFLAAFSEWAKYASLTFSPASGPLVAHTLNILFATGDHSDGYPFDGQSGALAHTFYPAPPNSAPIAGDMHFDDAEEWVTGADISAYSVDLFSVALHEAGHALGLGHSDQPGSVMYPYYQRVTQPTSEDIATLQTLYAAPETATEEPDPLTLTIQSPSVFPYSTTSTTAALSGAVTGGTGDVSVNWSTTRGYAGVATGGRTWSIAALPLQLGDNVTTITATDEAATQASKTVTITRTEPPTNPVLRITSPTSSSTYSTATSSVRLAGTASHSSGISRVAWVNASGSSGVATGTTSWQTGAIALKVGSNAITVTATSVAGTTAPATLTVNYSAGPDKTAPSISITYPASTSTTAYSPTISIRGTASYNTGVTAVKWSTSSGKSGTASGTTSWTASSIPLYTGSNTIVVRAYDAAGNTAWRSISVTRR